MDSPLMPTLKGHLADSSDLLADLSIMDGDADDSFMPPSPIRSSANPSSSDAASSSNARPPAFFLRGSQSSTTAPPISDEALAKAAQPKPRFSLFAPLRPPTQSQSQAQPRVNGQTSRQVPGMGETEEEEGDVTIDAGRHGDEEGKDGQDPDNVRAAGDGEDQDQDQTIHAGPKISAQDREDRLRESLYELRSMNEVFDGFLEALEAARSHNQRLEKRVQQTKVLLDQYTGLLSQTHHTQQVLSNPNWTGATAEASQIAAEAAEREAEEERQRIAQEEAAEAARLAEEERERRAADAAAERERSAAAIRGGRGRGRGWGTTGSTAARGTRGTGIPTSRIPSSRTAPGAGRGGASTGGGTQANGVRRVVSGGGATSGSGTGSGAGTAGAGGRYAHIPSSGYGGTGRRT